MYKFYGSFFIVLVCVFVFYNANIYTNKSNYGKIRLSAKALKGESLWLENNCNACHQLYGLGGYLGPDLTNVCSTSGKSDEVLKIFMISGVKSMPKFNFNSREQDAILQFLKEIDKTGYFPNKKAKLRYNGWVELKYKN